jgi:hypothetical protein
MNGDHGIIVECVTDCGSKSNYVVLTVTHRSSINAVGPFVRFHGVT